MDIPTIFHSKLHKISEIDDCQEPSLQSFVDDIMCTITRIENIPLQQTIISTLDKIELYMQSNKLALNRSKTQILVINKDPPLKSNVSIPAVPKNITPSTSIKFLGVDISETLEWKCFLTEGKNNLYKQLQQRISSIKKLRKFIKNSSKICQNFS